jgi:hypothetical protein
MPITLDQWRMATAAFSVALLSVAPAAGAANGGTGASVKAQMSANTTVVKKNKTFHVKLVVTATADIVQGYISFFTGGCALQIQPSDPKIMFDLPNKQVKIFDATFRMVTSEQCRITASVVGHESATARFASVFGVTINPTPEVPLPGIRYGRTADGQKTIEAPAAAR